MYKQDFALNNIQGLICCKIQPTKSLEAVLQHIMIEQKKYLLIFGKSFFICSLWMDDLMQSYQIWYTHVIVDSW